jgi:hypothetical protein
LEFNSPCGSAWVWNLSLDIKEGMLTAFENSVLGIKFGPKRDGEPGRWRKCI